MPQVLIRDLEQETIDALKQLAGKHGVSLEQELRDILKHAARTQLIDGVELARRLREQIEARTGQHPSSVDLLREDRDR